MARNKQKGSIQSAGPSITFGSMPFDVEQMIGSFTDPEELIKQLSEELSISLDEASAKFKSITTHAAPARLLRIAAQLKAITKGLFASEKIPLTEAKAREIVLACARGERYQDAKELVLVAAAYVKSQELSRAIVRGPGATWVDAYTAYELATWICASGVHHQIEVARGTKAATRARQAPTRERIDRLVAAITAGAVKMTPTAVLMWRAEEKTAANYERARRDLRTAQRALKTSRKTR
jgi:hypothetical protein